LTGPDPLDEYSHPTERLRLVLDLSSTQVAGTSVFADLDALYTHILSANPNVALLVRILGAYFAIPEPESRRRCVSFVDDILGVERGSVRLALRGLQSLLLIPASDEDQISVYHASLQDFLCNPERAGRFFLDIPQHHEELFSRCIRVVRDTLVNPDEYPPAL
jgi:hypothetical protein